MCLQCVEEKKSVEEHFSMLKNRKKIWQLERSFHCSVIGTCLSLSELNKLCQKLKISMQANLSDYDWHHSFVSVVAEASYAAKYISKYLDKKYKTTIKKMQPLAADEMQAYWDNAIEQDQLPAVYWALLTHPLTSFQLIDKMYGDVHMLSHLSGASIRVDMERLKRLEEEKKTFAQLLKEKQQSADEKSLRQSKTIRDLEKELNKTEILRAKLKIAESLIAEFKTNKSLDGLTSRLDEIEKKLLSKTKALEISVKQSEEWRVLAMKSGDQFGIVKADHMQLQQEHDTMERMLTQLLKKQCTSCDDETQCVNKDLNGDCVLYVGGRDNLNAHFRTLVEEQNGEFIYHDGGLNDGRKRLVSLLPKADIVFCPKDCISHEAVNKLKKFCKQSGKPLIMLRRSSLAAFSKGLSQAVA